MKSFNLSDWALDHKSFVVYLMLVVAIAGLMHYGKLGREEDPPFTIKTMVVKTLWPGATTLETVRQITDRIEKKLEELPGLDYLKSYTKPGESVVFVTLKDATRAADVADLWYQARKKIGDIRQTLPQGVQGPFFNDEFGDTYSLIFALTSDGFSHRELRDHAERLRSELLHDTGHRPRSISSAPRTRKSTLSSPPRSSRPWGSTSRRSSSHCGTRMPSSRAVWSMPARRRSLSASRVGSHRKTASERSTSASTAGPSA